MTSFPSPGPDRADSDRALDQWVRGALSDCYGSAADERLPEEWFHLVAAMPREQATP